ncbi:MAG: V-type ATP synthase subunit D [Elusimicrobiota bacterium]
MSKVKITKQELKKQKDSLARFERYLPTLQLKKKQLQRQIILVQNEINKLQKQREEDKNRILKWVDLFAQENPIKDVLSVETIETSEGSTAGVSFPVFERVEFKENDYDLLNTPLWVDFGIEAVKKIIIYKARGFVLNKQKEALEEELRITSQRVNLFEKVKIPESKENIRVIQIYLGERRTAAVVRGKIAKKKIKQKAQKQ